jgi:hypothetical protein
MDLFWDSSVRSASNWSAIEQAVVSAAHIFTDNFTTAVTLIIQVGFGEVDGHTLPFNATGESIINGDYVDYSTLTTKLATADAGLVSSGLMSKDAVTAAGSQLSGSSFFVAAAEEKALGLTPVDTVDGYIGLAKGSTLSFTSTIGTRQYDAVGVAAHELSEVMGRIGMEGSSSGNPGYYTPLDLFRYSATTSQVAPSQGAGTYFSINDGATHLANFNAPSNGGDAADWATSSPKTDAFNAFGTPGLTTQVTSTDLLAVAALGYQPAVYPPPTLTA